MEKGGRGTTTVTEKRGSSSTERERAPQQSWRKWGGETTTVTEKRGSSSRGIGHHSSQGERGEGETTTVTEKRGSSSREG